MQLDPSYRSLNRYFAYRPDSARRAAGGHSAQDPWSWKPLAALTAETSSHSYTHIEDREVPSTERDQAEAKAAVDDHSEATHWMLPSVAAARGLQTCAE